MRLSFYFIIVLYALLIPAGASLGLVDDHDVLASLFSGKNLDFYIIPELGRFYPLDGQEYNVISRLALSPVAFYIYNSGQFLLVVYLLLYLFQTFIFAGQKEHSSLSYLVILAIIFSPGFINSWFRLLVPERSQFVFFLLFLSCYLKYQKNQNIFLLLIGIASANVGLYYKEPGFAMVATLGLSHLFFGRKQINSKQKLFDILLILSAIVFISLYLTLVFPYKGAVRYGSVAHNPALVLVKNFVNYLLTDPLLILPLFTLVGYRLYRIFVEKAQIDELWDALLAASLAYVTVFFCLNMYAYHYLLPAYVFAIAGLLRYFIVEKYYQLKLFRVVLTIALVMYFLNALPVGLGQLSFWKNVPFGFQKTLAFLTTYLEKSPERVAIFLDGVDRGNGIEVYHSLSKYLLHEGIGLNKFDLKSDLPRQNQLLFSEGKLKSPFTVFMDERARAILSGDLLIVTPFACKLVDRLYLEELAREFELLFSFQPVLSIPEAGIKSAGKFIFMKLGLSSIHGMAVSHNILNRTDFFVFRKL